MSEKAKTTTPAPTTTQAPATTTASPETTTPAPTTVAPVAPPLESLSWREIAKDTDSNSVTERTLVAQVPGGQLLRIQTRRRHKLGLDIAEAVTFVPTVN